MTLSHYIDERWLDNEQIVRLGAAAAAPAAAGNLFTYLLLSFMTSFTGQKRLCSRFLRLTLRRHFSGPDVVCRKEVGRPNRLSLIKPFSIEFGGKFAAHYQKLTNFRANRWKK